MDPIIEIKNNRYGYLIPIAFIAVLMAVFYWAWITPTIDLQHSVNIIWKVIPIGIWVIGGAFSLYLLKCFVNPPVIFTANSEGFKANYNGNKTGLIYWKDIKETREMRILTSKTVRYDNYFIVMGVLLKDPEGYTAGKNLLMRTAIESMVNNYGTAIFIYKVSMSNSHYEKVKMLLEDNIAQKHFIHTKNE